MSELVRVASGELTGHAVITDDATATVVLAGTADYAALDAIENLLDTTHREAAARKLTRVDVDLRTLDFMNSSSLKCFVSWITELQELPAEQQYRVRFLSNPAFHWQRRSLHSLRTLAPDVIEIHA